MDSNDQPCTAIISERTAVTTTAATTLTRDLDAELTRVVGER